MGTQKPPKLLGLTGGIGSGKSTVANRLRELGATIVDADAISRATTAAGGSAMAAIRTVFGDDCVDSAGALDRAKMRDLVFADASARQKLERLTHPLIKQAMQDQIAAATTPWVVLDVPLLAERPSFDGWKPLLDKVCVVDCLESTQIVRVMARNDMPESQVRSIMAQQASRAARCAIADSVIYNEQLTFEALGQIVARVFAKLQ